MSDLQEFYNILDEKIKEMSDLQEFYDLLDEKIENMEYLIGKDPKTIIKDSQRLLQYQYDLDSIGSNLKSNGTFISVVQNRLKEESFWNVFNDLIKQQ